MDAAPAPISAPLLSPSDPAPHVPETVDNPQHPHPPNPTRRWQRLKENWAFLQGFVRHPKAVGALLPSSNHLIARIVQAANLTQARAVVELGPGTGGTTRAILDALPPQAHVLALERDATFHAHLRHDLPDPRLIAVHSEAEYLRAWLIALQWPAPDTIISGIPFSALPPEQAEQLVRMIAQTLAPGGRFVAYQLRAHVHTCTQPVLGAAAQVWEWRNLPPMRIWTWQRPHDLPG